MSLSYHYKREYFLMINRELCIADTMCARGFDPNNPSEWEGYEYERVLEQVEDDFDRLTTECVSQAFGAKLSPDWLRGIDDELCELDRFWVRVDHEGVGNGMWILWCEPKTYTKSDKPDADEIEYSIYRDVERGFNKFIRLMSELYCDGACAYPTGGFHTGMYGNFKEGSNRAKWTLYSSAHATWYNNAWRVYDGEAERVMEIGNSRRLTPDGWEVTRDIPSDVAARDRFYNHGHQVIYPDGTTLR